VVREEAIKDGQDEGSRIVVVPRRPGPLLEPGAGDSAPDELDSLLSDLFGPPDDIRPGWFDAAMVASGGALAGWSVFANGPGAALAVGACLSVIGLILPLRAVRGVIVRKRAGAARQRLLALGYPLDLALPSVARLAEAYRRVLDQAGRPGVALGTEAAEAAHLAMVEVATLFDGSPPGPAGVAYVDKRLAALADLEVALVREHGIWEAQQEVAARSAAADEHQILETRVATHERLESAGRNSLDDIAQLIGRAPDDQAGA
jgi:hypothetical protein